MTCTVMPFIFIFIYIQFYLLINIPASFLNCILFNCTCAFFFEMLHFLYIFVFQRVLCLRKYLAIGKTFTSFSDDKCVLTTDEVLFFPETFCVIPFCKIASVEFKSIFIAQKVIFHLTNNKKVTVIAYNKHCKGIKAALASNMPQSTESK